MAQTLVEDRSYHLSTAEEDVGKKHVYFVKLTDSCLKAIEEYIQYKASLKSQPKIKFEGQNGLITLPTKPGSANQDVNRKFRFGVSSLNVNTSNPLQGIIECIKHPDRKGNKLVSYGSLESKISIAATEDVYENTRNRMAQVDAERKDVRTKEIKLGNMKKSKGKSHPTKTKVLTPDPSHKPPHPIKKKVIPPTHKTASPSNYPSQVTSKKQSPVTNGKSFTCRERVIHILALRPHKKPELTSRLTREAMSQKDRNNLAMTLQKVSSLHDNQHKLHPHLYAEVQPDTWPFYNEGERATVKKNIAQHKKPEQPSSPQTVSSTSKSPEEKPGNKRPSTNEVTNTSKRPKTTCEEPSSTVSSTKPTTKEQIPTKDHQSSPPKKPPVKTLGEDSPPPMVASTSDSPEYLSTYKQISSYEQRCQYKRDFQAEYPEYMELKKNVDAVKSKFIELDQSWRRTEKGTNDYKRLQDEIMQAYENLKDGKYHEMKTRCDVLHQKLSHIKKLVVEYDNACLAT